MPRDAEYALDASAVLALVRAEPGASNVAEILTKSSISAVNFAEVIAVLRRNGVPEADADATLDNLQVPVIPFHTEHARLTADLIGRTRALGLSFGDCACLALARQSLLTVITAEKSWGKLDLGIPIVQIR